MPKNLRTPEQILRHAARLTPDQIHSLAWKMMDMAGIGVFAACGVADIREHLDDDEMAEEEGLDLEITDEQIRDAIQEAVEGDFSDWFSQARDAVLDQLRSTLTDDTYTPDQEAEAA